MKNSWLVWLFIVGVVITVLVAFNYQGNKETVPLSEIFPEEEAVPLDIEYEFVEEAQQEETGPATTAQTSVQEPKETVTQTASTQTEVKKEEVTTDSATTAAAVKDIAGEEIPFTIQVASFKSETMAQSSLKKVREKGYEAFIASKDLGEKGTWHRVYIGTFQTKPQADEYLTKVKEDYPSSFIISPR